MNDIFPLSQLIAGLLKPLPIALLILMIALLSFSRAPTLSRVMTFLSLILLCIFSMPYTASALLKSLEQQYPPMELTALPQVDAIVLLTGGLEPPLDPRHERQLGSRGDRLRLATELLKAGKANTLIIAGGYKFQLDEYKNEAEYSAELIKDWGATAHTAILEMQSRNTFETALNLAPIFDSNNIKSILLVTSAYHMPRSMALFKKLEISVIPAPANILITEGEKSFLDNWLPNSVSLSGSALAIHEYTGMLRNKFRHR